MDGRRPLATADDLNDLGLCAASKFLYTSLVAARRRGNLSPHLAAVRTAAVRELLAAGLPPSALELLGDVSRPRAHQMVTKARQAAEPNRTEPIDLDRTSSLHDTPMCTGPCATAEAYRPGP